MNRETRPGRRVRAGGYAGVLGVAAAAATLGVVASPALAAPLGTVTLSASSGNVTSDPIFTAATTSAPCPASYGANASLRVGPPGGPFANLAKPLFEGGYDNRNLTFAPNRSFATALGRNPGDGVWWVVVECFSAAAGRHPERFVTPITVTGSTWHVGSSGGSPAVLGPPEGGATPTPTAVGSTPVAGATDPTSAPAPTSAGASGTPAVDPVPAAARQQETGRGLLTAAVIVAGLLLTGAVGSLLALRRRVAPALPT
ncbi:hypothetical protein C1I95_31955, partial [Micromonospora craterilacus]